MELGEIIKGLRIKKHLEPLVTDDIIKGQIIEEKNRAILELQEIRTEYFRAIEDITDMPKEHIDKLHIKSMHLFEGLLENILENREISPEQMQSNTSLLYELQCCGVEDEFIDKESSRLRKLLDKEMEKRNICRNDHLDIISMDISKPNRKDVKEEIKKYIDRI